MAHPLGQPQVPDWRANIARASCARVVIFSTPDVDQICRRNGLPDLAALLRPFEAVERVNVRTSTFATLQLPSFGVSFFPSSLLSHPPEPDDIVLDKVVSPVFEPRRIEGWLKEEKGKGREEVRVRRKGWMKKENEWIEVPETSSSDDAASSSNQSTAPPPWYAALRDNLLLNPHHRPLRPYDTLSHPVASLVVVSTSHPEPLNGFAQMYEASGKGGSGWGAHGGSEWMENGGSGVLRYYVVVHEGADEEGRKEALELLDSVKRSYGVHSALLCINSLISTSSNSTPDPNLTAFSTPNPNHPAPPPSSEKPTKLKRRSERKDVVNTDPNFVFPDEAPDLPGLEPVTSPSARPTPSQHSSSSSIPTTTEEKPVAGRIRSLDGYWSPYAHEWRDRLSPFSPSDADEDEKSAGARSVVAEELGALMSETDVKMLRLFLREFTVQSLVPHMERSVQQWNEGIAASKRALTGRLFSAGRKYFGGSASSSRAGSPLAANGSPAGFNPTKGFYPASSVEAQTRRLADWAFMLHDYRFAGQTYESARKDFANDKAWWYYASATRMVGLCNLMLMPVVTPSNPRLPLDVDPFLEQAAAPLAALAAGGSGTDQMALDTLRSMVMYLEAYRSLGDLENASKGLVRAAGSLDEMVSAALLEQAALSQLASSASTGRPRKFAVHMVMAAHRYELSGQKLLSRHCLTQAAEVYSGAGWKQVRRHVVDMMGRQAFNAGEVEEAVRCFWRLVARTAEDKEGQDADGENKVTEGHLHAGFLEDFRQAFQTLHAGGEDVTPGFFEDKRLGSVTVFHPQDAILRIPSDVEAPADDVEAAVWDRLETDLVEHDGAESNGKSPAKLNVVRAGNVAIVGEAFHLELRAVNPLETPLRVAQIRLEAKSLDETPLEGALSVDDVPDLELGPREARRLFVTIRCTSEVSFEISDVSYRFHGLVAKTDSLVRRGARLAATKEHRLTPSYDVDRSLQIRVRSPVPVLSATFEGVPEELLEGETVTAHLRVQNVGTIALKNLRLLLSHPSFFEIAPNGTANVSAYASQTAQPNNKTATVQIPNRITLNAPFSIPFKNLEPDQEHSIPILVHGDVVGAHLTCWLFVFESATTGEVLSFRATHPIEVMPSLRIAPVVRAAAGTSSSYRIMLEIENTHVAEPAEIVQVSALSRQWSLESLYTPAAVPLLVDPHQVAALPLVASPHLPSADDNWDATFILPQLEKLLRGGDIKGGLPAAVSLLVSLAAVGADGAVAVEDGSLSRVIDATRQRAAHQALAEQFPAIAPELRRHLFPLYTARSVDVVSLWRLPKSGRRGHHVSRIVLGAPKDVVGRVLNNAAEKAGGIYAESQRERRLLVGQWRRSEFGSGEDPVVLHATAPESVSWAFASQGSLALPVKFSIRNLASFEASYSLSLLRRRVDVSDVDTSATHWVGKVNFSGRLEPHAHVELVATCWCPSPGVVDVGTWACHSAAVGGEAGWWKSGARTLVSINDVPQEYSQLP